jgi:putative ABC transport system substrate-binding protein
VGVGQFAVIQAVAAAQGTETGPINVRDAAELERELTAFAAITNGGMIVTSSTNALVHCDLIIGLAAKNKLPAVHAQREFVNAGGLVSSYGANLLLCA